MTNERPPVIIERQATCALFESSHHYAMNDAVAGQFAVSYWSWAPQQMEGTIISKEINPFDYKLIFS